LRIGIEDPSVAIPVGDVPLYDVATPMGPLSGGIFDRRP